MIDIERYNKEIIIKKRKILFYLQSDTLVKTFLSFYQQFVEDEILITIPAYNDENSAKFCKEYNIPYKRLSRKILNQFKPDVVCLLNDWSKEARRLIFMCTRRNIPVLCLQESIIDFGDKVHRMKTSSGVFIQGVQTFLDLETKHYFLTGNPRYKISSNTLPADNALINCNFTYGIYETVRDVWLNDITSVLDAEKIPFQISQHPRDNGDLSIYGDKVLPSNAFEIGNQIENSTLIITRFSSLIHEGLLQDKAVIYYNPHREGMKYNFRVNQNFLQYCESKYQFQSAVQNFKSFGQNSFKKEIDNYLSQHCVIPDVSADKMIRKILMECNLPQRKSNATEWFLIHLYHPFNLRFVKKLRSLLSK